MQTSDLLSHLNSISSSYHNHWNLYSAVVFGIGAAIAIKGTGLDVVVGLFLLVGLFVFLYSSFIRIEKTIEEIRKVEDEIRCKIEKEDLSKDFKSYYFCDKHSRANNNWRVFHYLIDAFLFLLVIIKTKWGDFTIYMANIVG